ncbi:hypothetical protein D3C81_1341710 [compost metagenome]
MQQELPPNIDGIFRLQRAKGHDLGDDSLEPRCACFVGDLGRAQCVDPTPQRFAHQGVTAGRPEMDTVRHYQAALGFAAMDLAIGHLAAQLRHCIRDRLDVEPRLLGQRRYQT